MGVTVKTGLLSILDGITNEEVKPPTEKILTN